MRLWWYPFPASRQRRDTRCLKELPQENDGKRSLRFFATLHRGRTTEYTYTVLVARDALNFASLALYILSSFSFHRERNSFLQENEREWCEKRRISPLLLREKKKMPSVSRCNSGPEGNGLSACFPSSRLLQSFATRWLANALYLLLLSRARLGWFVDSLFHIIPLFTTISTSLVTSSNTLTIRWETEKNVGNLTVRLLMASSLKLCLLMIRRLCDSHSTREAPTGFCVCLSWVKSRQTSLASCIVTRCKSRWM